jgi:hypothetical protein
MPRISDTMAVAAAARVQKPRLLGGCRAVEVEMKKVTFRIRRQTDAALAGMGERFIKAWKDGQTRGGDIGVRIAVSPLSRADAQALELVERLQPIGPVSVRGLARALGRYVKRVHEDVSTLIEYGLVARTATASFRCRMT